MFPFFDEHGVKVETVLSDNGREYCGREDRHPCEQKGSRKPRSRKKSTGKRLKTAA